MKKQKRFRQSTLQKSRRKISVKNHLSFVKWNVRKIDKDFVEIVVAYRTKERETGKKTFLHNTRQFRKTNINSPVKLARCLRQTMQEMLLHEINEIIYLSGKRIFDPHK